MSPFDAPVGGAGAEMHAFVRELFPICRSITGGGMRETLSRIQQRIPIALHEVPSGTRVLDWTVPDEWNVRDAWVANARGDRVIDFARHNLHLVGYSVPVRERMPLAALRSHLHSLPDRPDWIPYRTSYYERTWGFCVDHRTLMSLPDGEYDVCIDASLAPGHLTYGELFIPGATTDEILLSCHCCHPSLANDNLSGIAVAVHLAARLAGSARRHGVRVLFIPGTIGSITWLARNPDAAARVRHGLVLSCLGDAGAPTYKRSRRGNALVDRAAEHVISARGGDSSAIRDFTPFGYDERQYCSPGFDLPVGCLMRTPNGAYPEYHTSADDTAFVHAGALEDSLSLALSIIEILEHDVRYVNRQPYGEPQLGRRGLYGTVGGKAPREAELAMLWILNQSDGGHSLLDIANRSGLPFATLRAAAAALEDADLLARAPVTP
ncbi:MAG TPA: DUF4910 domain-containing protein [Gemmatimonadaceae bacterium]|nr:DUF4910 domain-containing protein [Gemmatimonadaceae bacterium]